MVAINANGRGFLMLTKRHKYLPFLMWVLPLLFFTYQFILRIWPGLMMNQIMEQLSIDASHFGLLTAFYYYGYAGMQFPVAILLDRYHVRYVICAFASICGLASLVFSYTDNWYLACISRFLIGAGSAVGFLGVSKVVSNWFPKEQYAKMIGFSFTIGLMGAIYGGKPVSLLIENYSWQIIAFVLSCVSIALGLATALFLRSANNNNIKTEQEFKLVNFRKLLSSPIIWLLAIANLLMVGSLEGFGDVWGVQYLMKAHNLNKDIAAELVSFIFVGMLFGGPFLAYLSTKLGHYKVIVLCGFTMAGIFLLLLSGISYNWYYFAGLFFIIGIMCCYQVIVFAAGSELVSAQLLGITIAFLNCINMLGGSFFHTIIGYLMDLFQNQTTIEESINHYSIESYSNALMIIPICSILGACIVGIVGYKLRK